MAACARRRNQIEPDSLNICMYTPTAFGGHARYTHELLSAMSALGPSKGVQVSLVTSQDLDSKYRASLYPIHDILPPLEPRAAFRNTAHWAVFRMMYYLRRERMFLRWIEENRSCEGIHFQEYTEWLALRHFRLLKERGKLLFSTVHQIYPQRYYPGMPEALFPLYHSLDRTVRRLCDALFVHTEDLREQLAENLGTGHPPIFVAPHGVWDCTDGTGTAANLEERVQRRRLLFFGVNRPKKGLHTLLKAMKELTDCTLTIAGATAEPSYQEQIRVLVQQLPSGQVELIDRFVEDDEKALLFNQSSLAILPYTFFAGQSGVLHDAIGHRIPVVVTDVGGVGESVRRWGIGKVVPPNDSVALARAIREMFTPRCYVGASRSIDRIKGELSWNRTAETIIDAYRSVRRAEL